MDQMGEDVDGGGEPPWRPAQQIRIPVGACEHASDGDQHTAPDRRRDGTNVLRLDHLALCDWTFQYGPGSFEKHLRQALARGLRVDIHIDEGLALDVDVPEDLTHPLVQSFLIDHNLISEQPTSPESRPHESDPS